MKMSQHFNCQTPEFSTAPHDDKKTIFNLLTLNCNPIKKSLKIHCLIYSHYTAFNNNQCSIDLCNKHIIKQTASYQEREDTKG